VATAVLTYHRIGRVDPAVPFHRLHTVDRDEFRRQLDLLTAWGEPAALDQVGDTGDGRRFVVGFDDVSTSALWGIAELRRRGLPYYVAPSTDLLDDGHGLRDRVYAIDAHVDAGALRDHVARVAGDEAIDDRFTFYRVTKSPQLDPAVVSDELVAPLFERLPTAVHQAFRRRWYLDWPTLRRLAADPRCTVVSHGAAHAQYRALDAEAIGRDVARAHDRFHHELGRAPRHLAVPFGARYPEVAAAVTGAARAHGLASVLWVGDRPAVLAGPPTEVLRLVAPSTVDELGRLLDEGQDALAA
jgi:hypothetical protein